MVFMINKHTDQRKRPDTHVDYIIVLMSKNINFLQARPFTWAWRNGSGRNRAQSTETIISVRLRIQGKYINQCLQPHLAYKGVIFSFSQACSIIFLRYNWICSKDNTDEEKSTRIFFRASVESGHLPSVNLVNARLQVIWIIRLHCLLKWDIIHIPLENTERQVQRHVANGNMQARQHDTLDNIFTLSLWSDPKEGWSVECCNWVSHQTKLSRKFRMIKKLIPCFLAIHQCDMLFYQTGQLIVG